MLQTEEKIKEIVEEILSEFPELFLVELTLKGNGGNQKLLVSLDGDKPVQIDQCVQISRKLGHIIEEEELIVDKYNLEVSSAGMGTPLKLERQYVKNQGRQVEVKKKDGEELIGKLAKVTADGIVLEKEEKEVQLAFNEIDKTKVLASFK